MIQTDSGTKDAAPSGAEDLVKARRYVIFTVTRYESTEDLRFRMCMDMLAECRTNEIAVVVVDGSPSDDVYNKLASSSGAVVQRQTVKGKKGAALREAAEIASKLPGVTEDTFLCWQEPEKVNMVRHWRGLQERNDDIIIPYRALSLFQTTYPGEQFHSEMYGNLFLDAVTTQELAKLQINLPLVDSGIQEEMGESKHILPRIDWHFGPLGFKAKHANLWTSYKGGDSYDAQLVPIVHAMRKNLRVVSMHVKYEAPLDMKSEEECNVDFIEKRLNQLAELDPRVKLSWTEDHYC